MDMDVSTERDLLLREVKYRVSYRGTLELDMVCRSLLPHLDGMSDEELQELADLLRQGENDLMAWLVEGAAPPERWALVVGLVRHLFKKKSEIRN
ncbi:MAG: hypothetical protein GC129_07320 [Proteobacteria bacterium]|nr:hypothetical protein [Pseudomonadota bacterium]